MFLYGLKRHNRYLTFSVSKRVFHRFDKPGAVRFINGGAILDDRHNAWEPFDLARRICAQNFVVQPHPQKALLIKEREKI